MEPRFGVYPWNERDSHLSVESVESVDRGPEVILRPRCLTLPSDPTALCRRR